MNKPRYKILPVKYHLYLEGDSPIFGESVTEISIDDEAGGPFLVLTQNSCKIRLDFEEIPVLMAAINVLKEHATEIEEESK